jgi:hypothetical protein
LEKLRVGCGFLVVRLWWICGELWFGRCGLRASKIFLCFELYFFCFPKWDVRGCRKADFSTPPLTMRQ